jgi:alpha-beta hydrolase superfamily lysophospholipase
MRNLFTGDIVETDTEAATEQRKPRVRVRTEQQKASDALGGRLRRATSWLVELDELLTRIHRDRSGQYAYLPRPLIKPGAKTYAQLQEALQRIEREAREGCMRSADWMLANAEWIGRVAYLYNTPPPKRAADYKPPPIVWPRVPRKPGSVPRSTFEHWRPHLERGNDD